MVIMKRGKKLTLKIQLTLFFIVFILAIFGVVVVTSFRQMNEITAIICENMGLPIARRAAALVPGDAFEKLCQTLDTEDPFYEDVRLKLLALKEETNCKYLYTLDRVTDSGGELYRFIIDGSAPPDDPLFSPLGAEENPGDYEKAFKLTWETGESQYGSLDAQTWGWLISSYVPIFNSAGIMVGIVGCDFEAEPIYKSLYQQIVQQIIFALFFIAVGIAAYIFFLKTFSRQNQELLRQKAISDLAAESSKSLLVEMEKQNYVLFELRNKADAASESKSSFLASTSHEIRTPMNAIIGMSELALREELSPAVREYISGIRQAGGNLLAIINDILDLSKIESGKLEIIEREYAFSSLVNDCTAIIRSRLAEKTLEFVTAFDPALPNSLLGDEARLRQIIVNLLSNAVKYTKEGKITFTIKGEPLPDSRINLVIAVTDTGIGIKPEDLPNLFGQFNRFDSQKNRSVEGTGLGLAICRSLCQAMDGDITAESEYGKGSTFTARIPQTVIDSSPFKIIEQSQAASAFSSSFIAPDAVVLAVDDIATNLVVVKGLLTPYRVTVHICLSGAEAIDLVQAGHYDLVLMDHMMPGMDGIEATEHIREFNKEIPVIALTANAISGMREMFLEKGFNDYLSKPIDVSKLDDILEKWIPKKKQKKEEGWSEKSSPLTSPFTIPGVDITKGIAMTGGTVEGYKKVLSMFRKDAEERLALLQNVPEEKDLPLFVTQVHALKSASGSIGAAEISALAAQLEAAGKAGDVALIGEALPTFAEQLAALTAEIGDALNEDAADAGKDRAAGATSALPFLRELQAALEAQKAETIDRIMEKLEQQALDSKTREALEQISDLVLMADYTSAAVKARELL
ncbi:hypothetical protein AGMMS49928_27880 [Spirochaetia bacterium]|nr:hypothetical protein AGMMS49928_27880 [Spirochaetia bacterium]